MTPAGLVLAAGAGTRFGRPKALVTIGGETFVSRAVRVLTTGGCAPVVAVLGACAAEVLAAVDLPGVVVNPDWAQGMGSSLGCGLAALPDDAPAVVIALADQPLIAAEAVRRLTAAWHAGAIAAVATYRGQPRNPVLLDRRVWADLVPHVHGDRGAGPWLRANPGLVTMVACDDAGSPHDVDTQQDLLDAEGWRPKAGN